MQVPWRVVDEIPLLDFSDVCAAFIHALTRSHSPAIQTTTECSMSMLHRVSFACFKRCNASRRQQILVHRKVERSETTAMKKVVDRRRRGVMICVLPSGAAAKSRAQGRAQTHGHSPVRV